MSKPVTIHTLESLRANCIEEGDCWIWQGSNKKRIPWVYHEGRMVAARVLVRQLQGKPFAGLFMSCSCDESRCINPDHILARSQAEHTAHMTARANQGTVKIIRIRNLTQTRRKDSKLTIEQAREIRTSDEASSVLARRHGIDKSQVARIRRGEAWREHTSPFAGLMS